MRMGPCCVKFFPGHFFRDMGVSINRSTPKWLLISWKIPWKLMIWGNPICYFHPRSKNVGELLHTSLYPFLWYGIHPLAKPRWKTWPKQFFKGVAHEQLRSSRGCLLVGSSIVSSFFLFFRREESQDHDFKDSTKNVPAVSSQLKQSLLIREI